MKNKRFEEYFLKYKSLIIKIVLDKTGDYQTAQEICQKVFTSFYTNMDRVSPEFVKAWLIRCAQNAVIDYIRKTKTKREVFSESAITEAGNILMEESVALYQEKMNDRELAGRILREVRNVNEQWYEVLMMCCVDGLSCEEAARKLNISESVLRARMYRARLYIKEKFGDEYKERKS
ncbi:MAG: RNA polymerase sigma factor [Lachnospiraceae bacterium]|nr:RNA polymerase sigma factor [Lachnospiraceae bacterium]